MPEAPEEKGQEVSAPDKCPKCGARVMSTDVGFVRFACMSYASTTEPVRESDTCLAFQRTQLAARVKELEEYAKRLENAGDSCCIFGPDSVLKDWTAAKESKP